MEKDKEQKHCHNCYKTINDKENEIFKNACVDCAELEDSVLRAKYEYANLALEMGRLLSSINERENKYNSRKFNKGAK